MKNSNESFGYESTKDATTESTNETIQRLSKSRFGRLELLEAR